MLCSGFAAHLRRCSIPKLRTLPLCHPQTLANKKAFIHLCSNKNRNSDMTSTVPTTSKAIQRTLSSSSVQSSQKALGFDDGPLVWIDLEMTGLNPKVDKIMEIAVHSRYFGMKTKLSPHTLFLK